MGNNFAGAIQILFGVFCLGKLIRLVPLLAVHGFVNGLANVIIPAQLHIITGQGPMKYCLVALSSRLSKGISFSLAVLAVGFKLHGLPVNDLADISVEPAASAI